MMKNMSYLPSMGLERRQHWPNEFMAILDHDVSFEPGFIPIEADYRYMARLRKERVRAPLNRIPFDYPIRQYTMSLADYFVRVSKPHTHSNGIIRGLNTTQEAKLQRLVHQLQLSDRAPGTSTFALVAPSSPDRMSLMTLYFPDEIDEHGTFAEIRDIVDGVVPHDEYVDEIFVMSMS